MMMSFLSRVMSSHFEQVIGLEGDVIGIQRPYILNPMVSSSLQGLLSSKRAECPSTPPKP
jgi:hypothetical protein